LDLQTPPQKGGVFVWPQEGITALMNDIALIIMLVFAGSSLGGALGARFSGAVIWKGILIALLATIVLQIVGLVTANENQIVDFLIYLAAVGVIGGRWGFKLSTRQLMHIVVGSFLVTAILVAMYVYVILGFSGY